MSENPVAPSRSGRQAEAARNDGKILGSGPYRLQTYDEGVKAELVKNDSYNGFADRKNDAVTIRYFHDSASMVEALRAIRRAVEAGVVVQVEGAQEMRTWQGFYDWAHGRYHMLEDGYDRWIGDDHA